MPPMCSLGRCSLRLFGRHSVCGLRMPQRSDAVIPHRVANSVSFRRRTCLYAVEPGNNRALQQYPRFVILISGIILGSSSSGKHFFDLST